MSKSKSTVKSKSVKSIKTTNFKNLSVPELEKIYENLRYEWLETTTQISDLNNQINPLVAKQKKICSDITQVCNQINLKSDKTDNNNKEPKKKIMSKNIKTKDKDKINKDLKEDNKKSKSTEKNAKKKDTKKKKTLVKSNNMNAKESDKDDVDSKNTKKVAKATKATKTAKKEAKQDMRKEIADAKFKRKTGIDLSQA